jgi:hypothetical protein
LAELVESTEDAIRESTYSLAEENVNIFDYASYAAQIKEQISPETYRSESAWKPVLYPDRLPRGSFEVLTAEALQGEALRRNNLLAAGKAPDQWQRPVLPGDNRTPLQETTPIWVNVYGTIPLRQQWEIYNQTFDEAIEVNRPEYVYYELERAEVNPKEESVWQPIIVSPNRPAPPNHEYLHSQDFTLQWDRLIPASQSWNRRNEPLEKSRDLDHVLLFSDYYVEPSKTYVYRMRLYLINPNYNLQESLFEEGVDIKSPFVRSDWSTFARIYVPDRTTVRLLSVTPPDTNWAFPRQQNPLGLTKGTVQLDYFDWELGHSLAPVEKRDVGRGMLCNMSKEEINQYLKRMEGPVGINYPDMGLRSDVCVLDFSGGRKLQKKTSKEAQSTPDLFVPGKALLLLPDGTMYSAQTE